jgi:ATP-binding cassette subfamily B protein
MPLFTLFSKKHACIQQHDITDCAAACLATIVKQYKGTVSIAKIREAADTDQEGTNVYGIIKAAETLGFKALGVKGTPESLYQDFQLPAIAHSIVNGTLLHYVVIHKITPKKIIVADPSQGIVNYKPEDFFKIWTGVLILLTPTERLEQTPLQKSTLLKFFLLLKPYKKPLLYIFFASLLYTIMGILGSFYFKIIMDTIIPNNLTATLHTVSLGIIFLSLLRILTNAYRTQLLLKLSQQLDKQLMLSYYQHVLKLPMHFFTSRTTGEIISRFLDASKIRDAISSVTLSMMIDTLMAVAGGTILYQQNSFLFYIALINTLLYTVMVYIFNPIIKRTNKEQMENNAILTSFLVESINGIETVKTYNSQEKTYQKTETKFLALLKSIFTGGFYGNILSSLTGFTGMLGGISIIWAGTYNVIHGTMTIGQLLTFNALLAYFFEPIKNLIHLQPLLQAAMVAANRLGEILDLEPEKDTQSTTILNPSTLRGTISFTNVTFTYGTRYPVLKNINLTIQPGQKIALVGESGSGKTTLAKLLMRLYTWQEGAITINNHNIHDISLALLRDKIAYVPQTTFLFNGTIRDNLSLGMEFIRSEKIIEIARITKAHDFIHHLPMGYDTIISENSTNFSGGQKQLIAITRALLKNPDILILDEATSNLDSITEKAIEQTIHEYTRTITTIIIAHRLSTIINSDLVFVMSQGHIAESGTHHDLLQKQGLYYNFWEKQR